MLCEGASERRWFCRAAMCTTKRDQVPPAVAQARAPSTQRLCDVPTAPYRLQYACVAMLTGASKDR